MSTAKEEITRLVQAQPADSSREEIVRELAGKYPLVWEAYNRLGKESAAAGQFDDRTTQLLKLALAIGAGLEGAVHSHVRRGLAAGATPAELEQVAVLGITTLGWPRSVAAYSWIQDELQRE